MKSIIRIAAATAGLAVLLQLGGCATSATSQAMTIKPGATAPAAGKLKGAVAVGEVTGGKDTNPLWTSQVDNAGFRKALQDSLAVAGYLAADPAKAPYKVDATLVRLDQPVFGLTFNVNSEVNYQLSGAGAPRTVPVKATGTASPSDAFVGVERLRIANERSVMENIKAFLEQIARLAD